jgi:membrane protein implicated in regulation of membrane protease activity
MRIDYSELAAKYSAMSEEEFDLLKREHLAEEAKSYYDCEKARRVPGWRWQPPPTQTGQQLRFSELTLLQNRLKRRFKTIVICIALCIAVSVVLSIVTGQFTGFVPGGLILAWLFWTSQRTGGVVVWLRRFHRDQQKPFQYFLENACRFIAVPVTIQDSSFRYSYAWSFVRLAPYAGLVVLPVLALGAIAFFVGDEIFGIPFAASLTVAVIMASALLVVSVVFLYRRFSFVTLRQSNAQDKTLQLLDKIRARKGRNSGVALLSCEDSFWRDVVTLCLRRADAIVIDVTDPSENVLWEIKTALELASPERILLACPGYANASQQLPLAVGSLIQTAVGPLPLSSFPTFFYPPARNRSTSSDLGNALIKCMSYAPPHDVVGRSEKFPGQAK